MVIFTVYTRYTACYAPYQPQAKMFLNKWRISRIWPDFRFILSNQKSVFTLLAANRICRKTGLNVGSKTSSIAFQLVLQQYCKTSCTFFFPIINKFTVQALTSVILYFPCSDLVLATRFIHRGFYWRIKMWVKISGWSAWKTIRCHKINSVSKITRQDTRDLSVDSRATTNTRTRFELFIY